MAAPKSREKMNFIAISDIIVGERFRVDLGDIDGLVNSIKDKGVIQPITVNNKLELLAGGRRTEAAKRAGLTSIPAIIRVDAGEIDAREIELIENVFRKDFSWIEECKLISEINTLYRAKDYKWSIRKTAELLDLAVGGVSTYIRLADALPHIPELESAKNMDEAIKMLKRFEEHLLVQELRSRQESLITKNVESQLPIDSLVINAIKRAKLDYKIGDIFSALVAMRSGGNIDLIECDPPYGIDLNKVSASAAGSAVANATNYQEIPRAKYVDFLSKLTKELFRVANKNCWMIFWYGPTWTTEVTVALRDAGWQIDEIPGIWIKSHGQTLQPELYLARAWEPFYLCRKGQPVLNKRGVLNVFGPYPSINNRYHPTQRPVELIQTLIETLLGTPSHILSPFLGSGATLRACYNLGHQAYGYDISEEYRNKFLLDVETDVRAMIEHEAS